MEPATNPPRWRRWAAGAALVGCGVLGGGIAAATLTANADTGAGDGTSSGQENRHGPGGWADSRTSIHPGESLLTGATAQKVEAAVLAEYPNATIVRTESDDGGVYESHITTSDGQPLTVEVDKSFEITGTESGGPGGPRPGESPDADDS